MSGIVMSLPQPPCPKNLRCIMGPKHHDNCVDRDVLQLCNYDHEPCVAAEDAK